MSGEVTLTGADLLQLQRHAQTEQGTFMVYLDYSNTFGKCKEQHPSVDLYLNVSFLPRDDIQSDDDDDDDSDESTQQSIKQQA